VLQAEPEGPGLSALCATLTTGERIAKRGGWTVPSTACANEEWVAGPGNLGNGGIATIPARA